MGTKWLDLNSKLKKQLGGSNGEPILEFKVHFFVSTGLIETLDDCSLKMYFLQLRTMLQQGVLKPRKHDAAEIGALVTQIEIGEYKDYFSDFEQGSEYLHQIIIYPEQERKPDLLNRIAEEHKTLKGMDNQHAMRILVENVSRVERYGIEIHCAKSIINPTSVLDTFERPDTLVEIGVSSEGICVFKNGIKDQQDLAWKHIDKIQCNSKQFILIIQADNSPDEYFKINFTFSSSKNCKACFLSCQAHHQFFQSQLSIEPSTSSASGYSTNTEFLCRSSSILKSKFKLGSSTITRKPRRQRRYLQQPSSQEPSTATNSMIGSSFSETASNRTSTGPSSANSNRNSMTVSTDQQLNIRTSNLNFPNFGTPQGATGTDHSLVASSSHAGPNAPGTSSGFGSSNRVTGNSSVAGNSNNPFMSSSWNDVCNRQDEQMQDIIIPQQVYEGGYAYEFFNQMQAQGSHQPFSPPSEASNDSWDQGDDDYEDYDDDVTPYYVGERPDPIQLPQMCNTNPYDPDLDLDMSMRELDSQLREGAKLDMEFQNAPQLRTDFTVFNSVVVKNREKNRYQDILPYDRSRVILTSGIDPHSDSDYINANHIVMILPGNSKLNYIAAQGPLEETITDFWRMVWEQNCAIVVMLTNVLEQEMLKCLPYWPNDTNAVLKCGHLLVTCNSPPIEENYVTTREIYLMDSRYPEQNAREIHLLHYTKWPDKKCPENSEDFLSFVRRVRKYRASFLGNSSLLVHCSAGIGRTGVFIIVETACRLIELGMPVLPLDLVRVLRDQRPYMIQTSEQFMFVCRAILTYYNQYRTICSPPVSVNLSSSSLNSMNANAIHAGSQQDNSSFRVSVNSNYQMQHQNSQHPFLGRVASNQSSFSQSELRTHVQSEHQQHFLNTPQPHHNQQRFSPRVRNSPHQ